MKYKVTVTQVFDTYDEWTKEIGIKDTRKEAEQLINDFRRIYYNRILVSYRFEILEVNNDKNTNA